MPVEHPAVDTIAPAFVATPVGIDVSHICQQYDRHQQNTSRREFHLHGPENQRVLILYAWCFLQYVNVTFLSLEVCFQLY